MKAIQIQEFGGPEVLQIRELPHPEPGEGEIVAAIHAASVNPTDWKTRAGQRAGGDILPWVPGCDFSGIVEAVGPGVTDFKPGDAVFGVPPQGGGGTYADTLLVDAALVARKPEGLSHVQSAAIALIGLTALVSLEDTAKIKSGETVLIQGGAGGVGGFGVQVAKHAGCTVYATCSTRNVDYVRGLGADHVIDYTREKFEDVVPPCDVVFDTVGGEVQERSFGVIKPGGRLAWIARGSEGADPPPDTVQMFRPRVDRDRAHLERIKELLDAGAVTVPEITEFPWERAGAAQELSATGHVRGKIVLRVR
ncbi:MAG: NADP-dependent oxidoreductase [Alphaproteobacteria bacterium]|nr:NADP-dependent oxidoreductase [Alphaproteobacteria bacterium]